MKIKVTITVKNSDLILNDELLHKSLVHASQKVIFGTLLFKRLQSKDIFLGPVKHPLANPPVKFPI